MMSKKATLLFIGVVFQLGAWNYPQEMEDLAVLLVQKYGIQHPVDAARLATALDKRWALTNGVIPSRDTQETILKGLAMRIANEELYGIEAPYLTNEDRNAVLAKQHENINACRSEETLSKYFDRKEQRKRLIQGIQGKVQNANPGQKSTQGDCSICFIPGTISPFNCDNRDRHDVDTWACSACQGKEKRERGICPFCRSRLK